MKVIDDRVTVRDIIRTTEMNRGLPLGTVAVTDAEIAACHGRDALIDMIEAKFRDAETDRSPATLYCASDWRSWPVNVRRAVARAA